MKYVYEGKQIVLVEVVRGSRQNLVILGNGYSIGDPFFSIPKEKNFRRMGTVLAMFFKKECSGLEEAQQELADFIKREYDNYRNVTLYGHSKCGVMFFYILSLIDRPVTSISVSAPFGGSFWADVKQVKKLLWNERSFGHKILKGWQYILYRMIFKNHAVDRDIIAGSEYLEKERTIPGYHTVVNVLSQCLEFSDEIARGNVPQAFFSQLNHLAGYERGDGIVSSESQLKHGPMVKCYIIANHMTSFNQAMFVLKQYVL